MSAIGRRHFLGSCLAGLLRAGTPAVVRRYRADAVITVFSIPIFSRRDVGGGFAVAEETGSGFTLRFAAGSRPDRARGLNRLGFIEERVDAERVSTFGFMTVSNEKGLDEAKSALESRTPTHRYVAAESYVEPGHTSYRVIHEPMPSTITWSDWRRLSDHFRGRFASPAEPLTGTRVDAASTPGAFLSTIRAAILDPSRRHSAVFLHNGKRFRLDTDKEVDRHTGRQLAQAAIPCNPDRVIRLHGAIRGASGERTPFTLWYEGASDTWLPLRFDYQARSFLRLSFVLDPALDSSYVKETL